MDKKEKFKPWSLVSPEGQGKHFIHGNDQLKILGSQGYVKNVCDQYFIQDCTYY